VFAETERMQSLLRDYLSFDRPCDPMRVGRLELGDLMSEIGVLLAGRGASVGVELSLRGRGGSIVADPRSAEGCDHERGDERARSDAARRSCRVTYR